MNRYPLPDSPLEVSALCLGAGGFGTLVKGAKTDHLVADFLAGGGNFLDTAHCYAFWEEEGLGASERELGACLRRLGARAQVVVATKGGHPDGGPDYPRPDRYLAPEVVASDIAESLERLGDGGVDLYYLHRDDPRVPAGEIVDALNREIAQGRMKALGASNWSVERIAAANDYAARHGLRGFSASQVQWSLAAPAWQAGPDPTTRTVTPEDAAWYAAAGLPIVAYTATANGFFADDGTAPSQFDTPANRARTERARKLAAQLGATATQIALAWLMRQAPRVIPLFSTTSPEHLAEALGSVKVVLTGEQARWLREG